MYACSLEMFRLHASHFRDSVIKIRTLVPTQRCYQPQHNWQIRFFPNKKCTIHKSSDLMNFVICWRMVHFRADMLFTLVDKRVIILIIHTSEKNPIYDRAFY